MDNNQFYWFFIVSLSKKNKQADYNRTKMDYNDTISLAINPIIIERKIINFNRL